uniref:Ovule protein n=1 Tax=Strongyloides venezuelensis TaxID=75913 RepID=A0A0K0G354_STRVS
MYTCSKSSFPAFKELTLPVSRATYFFIFLHYIFSTFINSTPSVVGGRERYVHMVLFQEQYRLFFKHVLRNSFPMVA